MEWDKLELGSKGLNARWGQGLMTKFHSLRSVRAPLLQVVSIRDFRGAQTGHIETGLKRMVYRDPEVSLAFAACAV